MESKTAASFSRSIASATFVDFALAGRTSRFDQSTRVLRWIVGGLVAVALVVLIAAFFPNEIDQNRGPAQVIGMSAPDVSVPLVRGGSVALRGLRGQDVLLNVWATWCGPCRREMPALERLARAQAGRLLVVAIDQGEDPRTAKAYADRFGITFAVGVDAGQRLGTALHLAGLPSSFFIDKNGVIREAVDGEMTYESMAQKAERLIAGG
jgi:cytochrome c biogenesis protein CcmG, thiol:disulfide interchange protein DsbE